MVLSCTVSDILQLNYKFSYPTLMYSPSSDVPFRFEVRSEVYHEEAKVMGLFSSEDRMIVV